MSSPSDDIHREVDPRIWRACAGPSVKIPLLDSRVYYFPQGHAEHCCGSLSPLISPLPSITAAVPCLVSSIDLLADPITDEVFVHLVLQPKPPEQSIPTNPMTYEEGDKDDNNKLTTYNKTLTASDVYSSLNVRRNCAKSVFPPLDFQANPPAQNLFIKDIHGVVWDFRHVCHVYRSKQAQHFLTIGWSKFVTNKKLTIGDSIKFTRNSTAELFVGIRRKGKGTSSFGICRRTGKGKLTVEAVSYAINRAAQGLPFEVVYYPTPGWSEFVVRAQDVEDSMSMKWTPGTKVMMAMETEDSSRIFWFLGIVSSTFQETGPWVGSTWKQLQITWDTPEFLGNLERVNSWQLEITFPDGMQGARHNEVGSSNPPEISTNNNFFTLLPGVDKVSIETTIGNPPPSDDLSSNKIITNMSSGNDLVGNGGPISTRVNSIRLFGKVINVQELSESCLPDSGLCEEHLTKESSDNE